jgi:hypothetical protein
VRREARGARWEARGGRREAGGARWEAGGARREVRGGGARWEAGGARREVRDGGARWESGGGSREERAGPIASPAMGARTGARFARKRLLVDSLSGRRARSGPPPPRSGFGEISPERRWSLCPRGGGAVRAGAPSHKRRIGARREARAARRFRGSS